MITLTHQDLVDILYGCAILGTGGGGSLKKGLQMVEEITAKGKQIRLVDFSEVPDDAWIATPYMCGSISPTTPELDAKYADLQVLPEPEAYLAYQALEKYFGKTFYGVTSTELGAGNVAEALYTAALLDRYVLDADPAGRSVPELQHSTFYIYDLPIYPLACANMFGDVAILPKVVNDERAEALVRAMAVASKNRIGVADHPAQAKDLRNAIIQGAISNAWKAGKLYRQAKEEGKLAGPVVAAGMDGYLLFQGTVSKHGYQTVDGFTVGDVYLDGTGDFAGSEYHIWYKNEHMASWKDGQIDVTVPDLICLFNDDTNEPNLNPYYEEGMKATVIGLKAPDQWRTPRGLDIFGPRHFNLGVEYIPIEQKHTKA